MYRKMDLAAVIFEEEKTVLVVSNGNSEDR
jgi:hypothetical protein